MTYSGVKQAHDARESLGKALAALQEDRNIPEDVMAVAQNIAQAVGALFEAERASSEPDGKSCVRNALGTLSQTLALLQDVRGQHHGIGVATEVIAKCMSSLYPLTTVPSKAPPPMAAPAPAPAMPPAPGMPQGAIPQTAMAPAAQVSDDQRQNVEANIGATTESNFYVGFSGEISEGGVFLATYETLPAKTPVKVLITLPGGFETRLNGRVRFVRDPLDFSAESEPGMGVAFEGLSNEQRDLILRFIRKRPPMFYDD